VTYDPSTSPHRFVFDCGGSPPFVLIFLLLFWFSLPFTSSAVFEWLRVPPVSAPKSVSYRFACRLAPTCVFPAKLHRRALKILIILSPLAQLVVEGYGTVTLLNAHDFSASFHPSSTPLLKGGTRLSSAVVCPKLTTAPPCSRFSLPRDMFLPGAAPFLEEHQVLCGQNDLPRVFLSGAASVRFQTANYPSLRDNLAHGKLFSVALLFEFSFPISLK